jgi:polygalacturonase
VHNVLVERCTFDGTENGIRIKSSRGKGGRVENLTYRDLTMTNVNPAISFTCYYPKVPATDEVLPVTPQTPLYRKIRISNLTATCPEEAGLIVGLPESPVESVVLENVKITSATGLTLRNAKSVRLQQVEVKAKTGPPFLVQDAEVAGLPDHTPNR